MEDEPWPSLAMRMALEQGTGYWPGRIVAGQVMDGDRFLSPYCVARLSTPNPPQLRVFPDQATGGDQKHPPLAALERFFQAFRRLTGLELQYVAGLESGMALDPLRSALVDPGVGIAPGYLAIGALPGSARRQAGPRFDVEAAGDLIASLAELAEELLRARAALAQREAELAATVPAVARPEEPAKFASRLESILRGGAEGVGCTAAGLYLLDAATTQLKLRSAWGLPPRRLTEPARPLQGAIADLEALTGHAVVLNDGALIDHFRVPEPCAAAVCVPVSTPSTVLGTMWVFSQERRDFSDKQVNLLEIVAGRVAGELERDALLGEALPAHDRLQQSRAVERLVSSRVTQFAPHIPGWDMAAQTDQPGGWAGNFCDWLPYSGTALAVALADANGVDGEAGFVAQAVRSAIRAHAMYQACPAQLLRSANQTLWCASGSDPYAAAMVGTVDPASGRVRFATAGNVLVLLLSGGQCTSLFKPELPLGVQPDATFELREIALAPGDVLIVATNTAGEAFEAPARALTDARTQRSLLRCRHEAAGKLAAAVRHVLRSHAPDGSHEHGAVLVVARHAAPCV